jgi:cell division protein FtsA
LESKERSLHLKKSMEAEVAAGDADPMDVEEEAADEIRSKSDTPKERKRFFDKWAEKFKEFLDNAE